MVVKHARSDEQRAVLEQINADGVCPFCYENLQRYHKNHLYTSEHWIVTENQWPYTHASRHILIIAQRHVESPSELTPQEWVDWNMANSYAMSLFDISSGAICMRFGDPELSGASVVHLHSHIVVPRKDAPEPIKFNIGGKKK